MLVILKGPRVKQRVVKDSVCLVFFTKISITLKIHFTLYFAHLESLDPYLTKPTATYSKKFKVKYVFICYYKSTKKLIAC